jgi:hypothetical protein
MTDDRQRQLRREVGVAAMIYFGIATVGGIAAGTWAWYHPEIVSSKPAITMLPGQGQGEIDYENAKPMPLPSANQ